MIIDKFNYKRANFLISFIFSIFINFFLITMFFNCLVVNKAFLYSPKKIKDFKNIVVDVYNLPFKSKSFSEFESKTKRKFPNKHILTTKKQVSSHLNQTDIICDNEEVTLIRSIHNEDMRPYIEKVYNKIEQNKYYPKIEQRRKHQGIVNIEFTIQRDGKVCDIKIMKESDYKMLDHAAFKTVLDCSPFEVFPNNTAEDNININVNVIYNLK